MNKRISLLQNISKLFFIMLFACSIFSITACDQVETVSLDAGLQSISVTKLPNKIKYTRSDKVLDITGLEVTAHYRSGYQKLLKNEDLTFTGFRSTEGYYTSAETIYITYDSSDGTTRQTSFQITYADLASINISSQPEKTRYTQNTPLDFTGIIINATYQDNSTQPVFSASILEALRLIPWGENEETILSDEEYLKIMNYRGRDEGNNASSLTIPLMYQTDEEGNFVKDDNGERILVSQLEFIGFDDTFSAYTEGQQQVIVKYTEITEDSFAIEREAAFSVKLASPASVTMISSPNKTHYTSNSVLNFDGMTLRANYSDGSTETIFSHDIYNNLVLFEDKKAEIENFVGGVGKTLSIPLQWKTDSNGNIVYKDGDWCPAREIIFSEYNSVSASGDQNVKVRYVDNWGDSPLEFDVSPQFVAKFAVLNGIVINSEPSKRKYKRGDAFNFSGLNIKSQYTNGETDTLFSDNVYKNLSTLTADDRLKIEAYTGKDGGSVVPLTIPLEWKRDDKGKIVTDGAGNNVALRELVFEGFDSSKIISSQEVTITLKDYSDSENTVTKQTKIGIGYVDMAGIQLMANPLKLKYFQNEPLDLGGIVIYAQYEDNSLEQLFTDEIFETILTGLPEAQKTAINSYKGDTKVGNEWFKQLEPRSTDTSNKMTIPLTWKKNNDGEYVNADGKVIEEESEEKVCSSGITVLGFDSTEIAGSQNVRLRYVDNSGYGTLEKEVSFQISYKSLSNIQITTLPKYTGDLNEVINFEGINIRAQYTDGSSKVIFSKEIYDALPDDYKPASLGNKYNDSNPLEITLEKDGENIVRQIIFTGFDTTVDTGSQTVTVTYKETNKAGTVSVYTQYQLRNDHLRSIGGISGLKTKYAMNEPSSDDTVGGPRNGDIPRTDTVPAFTDIAYWHFNIDGMELTLSYNNGNTKKLTFKNTEDNKCYGVGKKGTEAYVVDSNWDLLYMQRWAQEKDDSGNRYKIKITGFDPLGAFKAAKNAQSSQTLTISYTEGETTVSTQVNITYSWGTIFKPTETPKEPYYSKDWTRFEFGDYPQSEKKYNVEVSEYIKQTSGFFDYYLGSDAYLYCLKYVDGVRKYFKVEPILWRAAYSKGDEKCHYFYSSSILDSVPYYTGKNGRQSKKSNEFHWIVEGRTTYGTVNSTYDIGNYSYIYSTLRNWLNGDNLNGDGTYNGRGFLQTAFTPAAQSRLSSIPVAEQFRTTITGTANKVGDGDAITGTTAAYGENFTTFDYSSVQVIIPYNYALDYVERKFFDFTTTNGGIADRIRSPIKKYWHGGSTTTTYAVYNDIFGLADSDKGDSQGERVTAVQLRINCNFMPTDFSENPDNIWVASDVHTHENPDINRAYSFEYGNTDRHRATATVNTTKKGVVPVIMITDLY